MQKVILRLLLLLHIRKKNTTTCPTNYYYRSRCRVLVDWRIRRLHFKYDDSRRSPKETFAVRFGIRLCKLARVSLLLIVLSLLQRPLQLLLLTTVINTRPENVCSVINTYYIRIQVYYIGT